MFVCFTLFILLLKLLPLTWNKAIRIFALYNGIEVIRTSTDDATGRSRSGFHLLLLMKSLLCINHPFATEVGH